MQLETSLLPSPVCTHSKTSLLAIYIYTCKHLFSFLILAWVYLHIWRRAWQAFLLTREWLVCAFGAQGARIWSAVVSPWLTWLAGFCICRPCWAKFLSRSTCNGVTLHHMHVTGCHGYVNSMVSFITNQTLGQLTFSHPVSESSFH
jgi:hypothetical protein